MWDLLQLPLSLVFTRFLNLFADVVPLQTEPVCQFAVLIAAVILTGIGAALMLDMRLIPNPADGIVAAIADVTHQEIGLCKNGFDAVNTAIAVILGLALRGQVLGIGVGTLTAVLGNGRVIALFNRLFLKKLKELTGQV